MNCYLYNLKPKLFQKCIRIWWYFDDVIYRNTQIQRQTYVICPLNHVPLIAYIMSDVIKYISIVYMTFHRSYVYMLINKRGHNSCILACICIPIILLDFDHSTFTKCWILKFKTMRCLIKYLLYCICCICFCYMLVNKFVKQLGSKSLI